MYLESRYYHIGVAIDQPRAANCAKIINDMAATMENYRNSIPVTTPPLLSPTIISIF